MSWAAVAIGAGTAIAGGASAYMNSKNKPDEGSSAPNYRRDINQFVGGIKDSMPRVLGIENRYRDDFTGLNLEDVRNFMLGSGGERGVLDLNNLFTKRANNQLTRARGLDLRDMRGQAGLTRGIMDKLSPESAKMVDLAYQDAIQAQRNAKGLTGQEARSARQFALEGSQMQGREGDNSAIASMALNRDNILTQKRAEASAATQNAYGMANSFYTMPGLQALSQTPQSYTAGQQMMNLGLGAIGSAKPQMVDIGAGLNLGAANRQNLVGMAAANAQSSAAQNAALMGMFGNIAGGYLSNR